MFTRKDLNLVKKIHINKDYLVDLVKLDKLINYENSLDIMLKEVDLVKNKNSNGFVWIFEHNHVYTAGSSALNNEIFLDKDSAINVFNTGRGGKYTYHGPGQIMCYFVLNLREVFKGSDVDIKAYVKKLEGVVIEFLKSFNISSFTKQGKVGVWVDCNNLNCFLTDFDLDYEKKFHKKIAAIGVRVSSGVAFHGLCININPDLNFYNKIIPCGISDYGVCSLESLKIDFSKINYKDELINAIDCVFSKID
jgi:lipoyl(octanoyl) transferase